MYRSYFGIRSLPFGSSPDPEFLYVTPQVRESLACLQYGIATRKGFVVLTGEVGTGKSTLLKAVLRTFSSSRVSTAYVFNPRMGILDFLEFTLTDFGLAPRARTKSGMLIQLNTWLIEQFGGGRICVLVVDEAQNLSRELLEEIRLLTNLETSSQKLLQIVLSGQPELETTLSDASLRQLRQRIALWTKTRALTHAETHAYVAERLRIAGATEPIFSPGAMDSIYRHSAGIPRVINQLCENALISAYVEQTKPVQGRIVDGVAAELAPDRGPSAFENISSIASHSKSSETRANPRPFYRPLLSWKERRK